MAKVPRVLLTAFGPYGPWKDNASWQALVALTRDPPAAVELITRRYPVDVAEVQRRLEQDLQAGADAVVHLGQAPGSSSIALEAIALNLFDASDPPQNPRPLDPEGPLAYESRLPVVALAAHLHQHGIPARVSYHAGLYVCNATLYWTHRLMERAGKVARACLVHVPVTPELAVTAPGTLPSMPSTYTASALHLLLMRLAAELEAA